jgi:ABC-type transport system involved in multi-copper enzyme maturation permease subunit
MLDLYFQEYEYIKRKKMIFSKAFLRNIVTLLVMAIYGLICSSVLLCMYGTIKLIEENKAECQFFGTYLICGIVAYFALNHTNGKLGRGG